MSNIIIIGGDDRQREMNNIFTDKGMKTTYISSSDDRDFTDKIKSGDTVILPVPVSKDKENIYSSVEDFKVKISDVLSLLDTENTLFGGGFSENVKTFLKEKNIQFFDYLDDDNFVIYNAYLTGLGAVKLLLQITDEDIKNKKALVTGFGRVAEFTAQALMKAGCDVYVTARNKKQLLKAECIGYKTLDFDKRGTFLYLFDYVFNTVPENIFSENDVSHIRGKYFELASAPYGSKKEFFNSREADYINGLALPGRFLSHSAAERLAEITLEYLNLRNGGD